MGERVRGQTGDLRNGGASLIKKGSSKKKEEITGRKDCSKKG